MEKWEIVEASLWQSGSLTETLSYTEQGINVVVDLEGGLDQFLPPTSSDGSFLYVWWPIQDGPIPDNEVLVALADFIVALIRDGRKVLVHCAAGINRSGLVNALILNRMGMPGRDAVARVREKRPSALSNPTFTAWLEARP